MLSLPPLHIIVNGWSPNCCSVKRYTPSTAAATASAQLLLPFASTRLPLCANQIREVTTPEGLFPEAKLLDFGLSKMVGEDMGSAARTFVGTPCYLAPEVRQSHSGSTMAHCNMPTSATVECSMLHRCPGPHHCLGPHWLPECSTCRRRYTAP